MQNLQSFLAAPTNEQRLQFELLTDKGLSPSYYTCYIQTPIHALTKTFPAIVDDAVCAPSKKLKDATIEVFRGNFSKALKSATEAVVILVKSILQIIVLASTVFVG
ncbi:MAG: hypothetical protein ACXVAJ_05960, partial [Parachlamydiaceae bacterium]